MLAIVATNMMSISFWNKGLQGIHGYSGTELLWSVSSEYRETVGASVHEEASKSTARNTKDTLLVDNYQWMIFIRGHRIYIFQQLPTLLIKSDLLKIILYISNP